MLSAEVALINKLIRITEIAQLQHGPAIFEALAQFDEGICAKLAAATGLFQFRRVVNEMDLCISSLQ